MKKMTHKTGRAVAVACSAIVRRMAISLACKFIYVLAYLIKCLGIILLVFLDCGGCLLTSGVKFYGNLRLLPFKGSNSLLNGYLELRHGFFEVFVYHNFDFDDVDVPKKRNPPNEKS